MLVTEIHLLSHQSQVLPEGGVLSSQVRQSMFDLFLILHSTFVKVLVLPKMSEPPYRPGSIGAAKAYPNLDPYQFKFTGAQLRDYYARRGIELRPLAPPASASSSSALTSAAPALLDIPVRTKYDRPGMMSLAELDRELSRREAQQKRDAEAALALSAAADLSGTGRQRSNVRVVGTVRMHERRYV